MLCIYFAINCTIVYSQNNNYSIDKILEDLKSNDKDTYSQALISITDIKEDLHKSIPYIIKIKVTDNSPSTYLLTEMALKHINKDGNKLKDILNAYINMLDNEDTEVVRLILGELLFIGPEAEIFIEDIAKGILKVKNINLKRTGIRYTKWIAKSSDSKMRLSSVYASFLNNRNPETSEYGYYGLISMGVEAKYSVQTLIKYIKIGNNRTKLFAIEVLGVMRKESIDALPIVLMELSNDIPEIRAKAALAISRICPGNDRIAKILIDRTSDINSEVVAGAIEGLGELGKICVKYVPILLIKMNDNNHKIRISAIRSLGKISRDGNLFYPEMIPALEDNDLEIKYNVVHALGMMGPKAIYAMTSLVKLIYLNNDKLNEELIWALKQIGSESDILTIKMINILKEGNPKEITVALEILAGQGRKALPALPDVMKYLISSSHDVRLKAIYSISKIGRDADSAIPALIDIFENGDWECSEEAGKALNRIGDKGKDAIINKIYNMSNEYEAYCMNNDEIKEIKGYDLKNLIKKAAWSLASEGKDAVQYLVRMLNNSNGFIRETAVIALGDLRHDAIEAVPALKEAANKYNDNNIRMAIKKILR